MSNKNWNNLEGAELALREIYMACGNPDPSDGEGTGYDEIVKAVHSRLSTLEQRERELVELLSRINIQLESPARNTTVTSYRRDGSVIISSDIREEVKKALSNSTPSTSGWVRVEEVQKARVEELEWAEYTSRLGGCTSAGCEPAGDFHGKRCPCGIANRIQERLRTLHPTNQEKGKSE